MRGEHFEWDDYKSASNKAKHGFDFAEAGEMWKTGVDEFPSPRGAEMRYVAFGELNKKLALVVLSYNGSRRRIISARYSLPQEKAEYENAKLKKPLR